MVGPLVGLLRSLHPALHLQFLPYPFIALAKRRHADPRDSADLLVRQTLNDAHYHQIALLRIQTIEQ